MPCTGPVTLGCSRSAGLLDSLPCLRNADPSEDGTINAIDATLILQLVAGLLDSLPP